MARRLRDFFRLTNTRPAASDQKGRTVGFESLELRRVLASSVGEIAQLTGDSNLDGVFDQSDLVAVFQAGKYESGQAASWSEGDWNGDQRFDSADLVLAMNSGGYGTSMPTRFDADDGDANQEDEGGKRLGWAERIAQWKENRQAGDDEGEEGERLGWAERIAQWKENRQAGDDEGEAGERLGWAERVAQWKEDRLADEEGDEGEEGEEGERLGWAERVAQWRENRLADDEGNEGEEGEQLGWAERIAEWKDSIAEWKENRLADDEGDEGDEGEQLGWAERIAEWKENRKPDQQQRIDSIREKLEDGSITGLDEAGLAAVNAALESGDARAAMKIIRQAHVDKIMLEQANRREQQEEGDLAQRFPMQAVNDFVKGLRERVERG